MLTPDATEEKLIDGFLEALQKLPAGHAELRRVEQPPGAPAWPCDALVDIRMGEEAVTLLVELKTTVYPRDARQALWRIREFAGKLPNPAGERNAMPLLLAQSISPGAKDLLRSEQVGYYDSGGSLYLPARNIYVYVDKPPPRSLVKSIRSVFSDRRSQVLHAMLMRSRSWISVKEVASQARVAPATASQVLRELEKFDWVVSRGRGPRKERLLQEPGALLDAWASQLAAVPPPPMHRYFVPSVRVEELTAKFAEACAASGAEYAITHEAAAQSYAPFLSNVVQVRCRLLAGPAADGALGLLNAQFVDQGANLVVIEAKSPGALLFCELVNRVWLASAVQVYLDLIRSEGRAKEMANHLRHERIGF